MTYTLTKFGSCIDVFRALRHDIDAALTCSVALMAIILGQDSIWKITKTCNHLVNTMSLPFCNCPAACNLKMAASITCEIIAWTGRYTPSSLARLHPQILQKEMVGHIHRIQYQYEVQLAVFGAKAG